MVAAALKETIVVLARTSVELVALLSAIKLGLADVAVNFDPLNNVRYNRFSTDVIGKLQGTVTVLPTVAAATERLLPTV